MLDQLYEKDGPLYSLRALDDSDSLFRLMTTQRQVRTDWISSGVGSTLALACRLDFPQWPASMATDGATFAFVNVYKRFNIHVAAVKAPSGPKQASKLILAGIDAWWAPTAWQRHFR